MSDNVKKKGKKAGRRATPAGALRQKAEKKLKADTERRKGLSAQSLKKVLHELGTHQIELEMQNEELRGTQIELESSRTRYADLYDFSPVGYFTFDANGLVKEVNLTGAGMLGSTKRLLLNKPILPYIDPAYRAIFHEHREAVFRTHDGAGCEITVRRKDGAVFHAQLHSLFFHTKGSAGVCRTTMSDVTVRKRVEDALQESERAHRTLAENIPDIVYRVDLQQHATKFFNDRIIEITGYRPGELRKGSICSLESHIVEEDRQRVIKTVNRAIQDRSSFEVEYRFRHKNGRTITLLERSSVVSDGPAVFIDGIIRDITERKRAEEELRESEEKFSLLFQKAGFGVALATSPDGVFVDANEAATRIFGYSRQEIIGRNSLELGLHRDPEARTRIFAALAEQGSLRDIEVPMRARSGEERFILMNIIPLELAGRTHHIVTLVDITKRTKAEEALRSAHAELEQRAYELTAVNKELEAFSHTVSHDLRAPLRSIEGFTNAILEDHAAALDGTAKDYFNRVIAASRRMDQLIEALLKIARLTKSELRERTVDLSGLAEVAAHELRKQDPSRTVEFAIAKKMKVRGDTDMLRMVVENLLNNAWKFTSGRPLAKIEFGILDRETKAAPSGPDPAIRLCPAITSARASAGYDPKSEIVYFVRDDGAGFDMTYADKLFKPFQRLHKESEFPGIGIGLATVKRIVERHGGRIWAESEPDKGATFFFTLGEHQD